MSTAGKVLVILVVLSLLGWMYLAALVADHHINWTEKYAKTEKELADLTATLPPIRAETYDLTNQANNLQVSLDRARRNFRAELAMEQKEDSETKESLSRYQFQLKQAQVEVTSAQKRASIRLQERTTLEQQIRQEQATVADLTAKNTDLKGQLEGLRKAFTETLAANKAYVDKLRKASPTGDGKPRTRLGSLIR